MKIILRIMFWKEAGELLDNRDDVDSLLAAYKCFVSSRSFESLSFSWVIVCSSTLLLHLSVTLACSLRFVLRVLMSFLILSNSLSHFHVAL